MEIHIDEIFMSEVKSDELNSLDLRSDIENNNIYGCTLYPQGYVGNRPSDFEGKYPEDDTWAIDAHFEEGYVESYLYVSEFEYNQDVELLKEFK